MKKYISVLLILLALLVWAGPALAATVPAGFSTWALQTTTDTGKVWTVKFSMPVDAGTVTGSNIYVTDDSNRPVSTKLTLSTDGTAVQVSPVSAYTAGSKYWLFITGGITGGSGKQVLSQPVAVPFTVTSPNSKIISVTDGYSSLLTGFTVVTTPDVFSVKIASYTTQYQGNNTFAVGITGLTQGTKLTVYAYDSNGVLLQSESYTVN